MEDLPGRRPPVSLVLDSSVTLAWLYSDEITEAIRRVFEVVAEHGAVVPALWRLEIANSLTVAARRARIDGGFRRAALSDLAMLEITTDPYTEPNAWGQTLQLADQHGLTVYDAAYLELALRRRLPLATLDEKLRAGATGCGVELLGKN
jgi:predicted nucleic acid-binding protein